MNFRFFADHLLACTATTDDCETRGHRNHVTLGPGRRDRDRHAVERAAHARHLAHRPRARRRQHRRRQAAGVGAADGVAARRHRRRGRPARRRVQRRPGPRRRGRRAAGRAPRRRRISFTGSVPDGAADRRRGRRRTSRPVSLRARRQVTAARLRRRRPRPRRRPRRRAVRQLRPGLPGRRPDPGRRSRSPTSSPSAFWPRRRGDRARATRATRRPTSGRWSARAHLERVDGFVQRAIADGRHACCSAAGRTPSSGDGGSTTGRRCSRTSTRRSEILTEEVFGPVLTLQTFAHRGGGGRDGQRHRVRPGGDAGHRRPGPRRAGRRPARAGTVWVNCFFVRDLRAPFGGNGHSPASAARAAPGRFDFYCDVKNTSFAPHGMAKG